MSIARNGISFSSDENPFISYHSDGSGQSRIFDIVWDFSALGQTTHKVSFKSVGVTHRKVVQSLVAQMIEYTKDESDSGHFSVSTVHQYKKSLSRIINIWGKSDFSLLDNDQDWEDFRDLFKDRYSESSMAILRNLLSFLHKLGVISRYVTVKDFQLLARKDGSSKQALALPQQMHAQMLFVAIELVEKHHAYRHEISKCMVDFFTMRERELLKGVRESGGDLSLKELKPKVNQRIAIKAKKIARPLALKNMKLDSYGTFVSKLVKCCFLVVAAFSGARKSELSLMNPDSYHEINDIPYISSFLSKSNEGIPVTVVWQTHSIVKKALELAYDATEYVRSVYKVRLELQLAQQNIHIDTYNRLMIELGSSFLQASIRNLDVIEQVKESFIITKVGGNVFDAEDFFKPATEDDVHDFNVLNPTRIGELEVGGYPLKFSPHDIRRSFAVFIVRNGLGNTLTVKEQFKHKNLSMANYYAQNAELARIQGLVLDEELLGLLDVSSEEAIIDAFDDIYNGSEFLSGLEGERIMKAKEEALRKGEKIYMSRSQLHALVKFGDKSIVMLPSGAYCTNPTCERLCAISYFNSEDKPCEHEVVTTRGAKMRANEHSKLIKAFREMNEMNDFALFRILVGMKEKIIFIESTLRKHNLSFKPFDDKIKALAI